MFAFTLLGHSSWSLLWWHLGQWAHLGQGWGARSVVWCVVTFDPASQVIKGRGKKKERNIKPVACWLSTFHTVSFGLCTQPGLLIYASHSQLANAFVSLSSPSCHKPFCEHYECKNQLQRWGKSLRNEEWDLGRGQKGTSDPCCLRDYSPRPDLSFHAAGSHACEYGFSCFTAHFLQCQALSFSRKEERYPWNWKEYLVFFLSRQAVSVQGTPRP